MSAFLAGLALFYYLRRLEADESVATENIRPWYRSALVIGLALTVFGPIPAWITGQIKTILAPLSQKLTQTDMIDMNYAVDAQKKAIYWMEKIDGKPVPEGFVTRLKAYEAGKPWTEKAP